MKRVLKTCEGNLPWTHSALSGSMANNSVVRSKDAVIHDEHTQKNTNLWNASGFPLPLTMNDRAPMDPGIMPNSPWRAETCKEKNFVKKTVNVKECILRSSLFRLRWRNFNWEPKTILNCDSFYFTSFSDLPVIFAPFSFSANQIKN